MIRKLIWAICAAAIVVMGAPGFASPARPSSPKEFGLRDLLEASGRVEQIPEGIRFYVCCPGEYDNAAVKAAGKVLPKKPESFAIARSGKDIAILGSDEAGAMYGCLELAERLDMVGRIALDIRTPIVQSPKVEFRAVNPFLTVPYKESEEDWWFLREDYWAGYLDQLARARINWVDLHGMYDVKTTWFPSIYPYFITSERFPEAGAEPEVARRNLDMLNNVIRMAGERGIRFAIMSYSATWDGPGLRKSPYENTEENLAAYTREVVRKMIEACPDLAMIGFRIGESGKSESFFKDSYVPAIKEAGRPIDMYTRTWLSSKPPIIKIGDDFPGRFFIEIKYNGEQFGPPYMVAGGRMQGWHSYSYQDYYSYPRNYRIIYQLRANGTHRVFPWGSPELAARANECSLLGGAIGLCVEPIDAYYPKHDFRHRDDSPNQWYEWNYQRDWFWYGVWGRTAYDPSLASRDDIWAAMFASRFGKDAARDLLNAMKWASMIVPDAYSSYSLGPDHRNHAPELEWGGDVRKWADGQPFDTQNIQSPREYADRLVRGDFAATATPMQMADRLAGEARSTRYYLTLARRKVNDPTPEFDDLVTELRALSYLADYYAHKLRAAALFAVMEASSDVEGDALSGAGRIREELALARGAWESLAAIGDEHYKPFVDTLRMGTEEYAWSQEGTKLDGDLRALEEAVAEIKASGPAGTAPRVGARGDATGPSVTDASSKLLPSDSEYAKRLQVTVLVTDPSGVAKVMLKTKPMPSERVWSLAPMELRDGLYRAEVVAPSEGLMWCIEALDADGNGTMWPNFRKETPYRVVLPWETGAALVEPAEALSMLPGMAISPARFSAIIAARDAFALNSAPEEVHQAVMKLVGDGLPLILMAQDAPGKWDGAWLGGEIEFTDADAGSISFLGEHPILEGLPRTLQLSRIVNDALEGGDASWTHLSEPKALAVGTVGKGCIIVMQMDLDRNADSAEVRKLLSNAAAFARRGNGKPMLLIDPGGGSIHGMLGRCGLPYVTLAEIAAAASR